MTNNNLNYLTDLEKKKLEQLSLKLQEYNIPKLDIDTLKFAFSSEARCHELRIRRARYYAVIGDSILDTVIYKYINDNYDEVSTKGDLDDKRQELANNPRFVNIMINTDLVNYILLGNGEYMISDSTIATSFEAVIFIIDRFFGIKTVSTFLNSIDFFE